MKTTLFAAAVALLALSAAGSPRHGCSLEAGMLEGYKPGASVEQSRNARRALSRFLGCDVSHLDDESRRLFFAAVEGEFSFDHSANFEWWAKTYPESEALWEAIHGQQAEMREYLDRVFDPGRDKEFESVVLRFGTGRTMARLGRDGKDGVKEAIAVADGFYGLNGEYNSRVEGMVALGYWLAPENSSFTPGEKEQFAGTLYSLLDVSEQIRDGHHRTLVLTALNSLSMSADARAVHAIERWISRRDAKDELVPIATRALASIKDRLREK